MSNLIKFPLESGGFIYLEVAEAEGESGLVKAGRGLPEEARESFESAIGSLGPVTNAIISKLVNVSNPPDEASVEFGLTLKADAGMVITKVGTEASFKVNLKWTRDKGKV
jgi:hypothetical protein